VQLRDPHTLRAVMVAKDMTGARLGRLAGGVSRQFVNQLLSGRRTSCSDETAALIENALDARPGSLFLPAPVKTRQDAAA
jgi:hypothetical protein